MPASQPSCECQAALAPDRKTEDGLKESAKFFQEAAGSFAFLRDVACIKVESPRPVDISPECATMLEKLMLAQVLCKIWCCVRRGGWGGVARGVGCMSLSGPEYTVKWRDSSMPGDHLLHMVCRKCGDVAFKTGLPNSLPPL